MEPRFNCLQETYTGRFQRLVRSGVLKDVLEVLAEALHDEGYLDLRETSIDGSFAPAKKGGACVGTSPTGSMRSWQHVVLS